MEQEGHIDKSQVGIVDLHIHSLWSLSLVLARKKGTKPALVLSIPCSLRWGTFTWWSTPPFPTRAWQNNLIWDEWLQPGRSTLWTLDSYFCQLPSIKEFRIWCQYHQPNCRQCLCFWILTYLILAVQFNNVSIELGSVVSDPNNLQFPLVLPKSVVMKLFCLSWFFSNSGTQQARKDFEQSPPVTTEEPMAS